MNVYINENTSFLPPSPELSQFIGANDPKLNPETHIPTTNLFESHHNNTQIHTFKAKMGNLFSFQPSILEANQKKSQPTKRQDAANLLLALGQGRLGAFLESNVVAAETNSKVGPWKIGKKGPNRKPDKVYDPLIEIVGTQWSYGENPRFILRASKIMKTYMKICYKPWKFYMKPKKSSICEEKSSSKHPLLCSSRQFSQGVSHVPFHHVQCC